MLSINNIVAVCATTVFALTAAASCANNGANNSANNSANNYAKPLSRESYVDLLYQSMPLRDSLEFPRSFWEEAVGKTLDVREKMAWGIPEREFRHFVLPLRVNNEDLDSFRVRYADEVCERVEGMSLGDAILEINHWCHEKVSYTPTDARTRGPLALIAGGKGRCGEESTFTVSALRAAGIPARQVYAPRWTHVNDNHAWVEAWVDGKWHYLGACEPDPRLDMGWFYSNASRAMLVHTKVSGDYQGDEPVISRNPIYTEINVLHGYAPTRRSSVTVRHEDGTPAAGVEVLFKIFNYQEFCTVCSVRADSQGCASLDTGFGDMLAWAADGGRFGYAKVSADSSELILNHSFGEIFSDEIDIVPPAEGTFTDPSTEEERETNQRRIAYEDSLRNAAHAEEAGKAVLDAFKQSVADNPTKQAVAQAVMASLLPKDLWDVSADVLNDAVSGACSTDPYVVNPRISLEKLYPFMAEIRSGLQGTVHTPEEAFYWVKQNIRVVPQERNPQKLRIPPVFVWRSRICDAASQGIFFVAACRALGFPARLDPVTGRAQFLKAGTEEGGVATAGVWMDADFNETTPTPARQGTVRLVYRGKEPVYFEDYTISRIAGNSDRLMDYEYADMPAAAKGLTLDEGYYVITTGKRLPDGSVLSRIGTFNVSAGKTAEVPVVTRDR